MESLCAFLFFWQALFVHGKPIFSAQQVTKNAKKIGPGFEHTPENQQYMVHTTGPLALYYHLYPQTMYRRRDDCNSVLHTHPAHSGMQMGSLCAFIFFQKALFVQKKMENQFSQEDTWKKMPKNCGP